MSMAWALRGCMSSRAAPLSKWFIVARYCVVSSGLVDATCRF
jgi:hypothetical protein